MVASLPKSSRTRAWFIGSVRATRSQEKRAYQQAADDGTPGLAFSASGSLGIRRPAGMSVTFDVELRGLNWSLF